MRYNEVNGTSYHVETSGAVVRALEEARQSGRRVRLTYGYVNAVSDKLPAGRAWLEENDVDGTIGRSCGSVKVPILLHNSRSMGGGAILDHCIVRITTTSKPRRVLYQHPQYSAPVLEKVKAQMPGYAVTVLADGKVHARFKTAKAADKWLARMA